MDHRLQLCTKPQQAGTQVCSPRSGSETFCSHDDHHSSTQSCGVGQISLVEPCHHHRTHWSARENGLVLLSPPRRRGGRKRRAGWEFWLCGAIVGALAITHLMAGESAQQGEVLRGVTAATSSAPPRKDLAYQGIAQRTSAFGDDSSSRTNFRSDP
jgi:hypothetical protein